MIAYRSSEEIEKIAASGKILASVMEEIVKEAKAGVRLKNLDKLAEKLIGESGARPAFLNYKPDGAKHPYRASICTSLNEVVVHGFPSLRALQSGDVLKLDFGVLYDGFYADAAVTILVGSVTPEAQKLAEATRVALKRAIQKAKPGNTLGDIGFEIESTAKRFGFKVIKGLTGHGIGSKLHEDPVIHNYGEKKKGIKLKSGMVLAIEPMFSAGSDEIIQLKDESWATKDGSLSAHFEHTVVITEREPIIFTE